MIVGIGCDIVDHGLTGKLKWEERTSVQNRIFSLEELSICKNRDKLEFLSGRFAAKEAVLKCLGTGMIDGISLSDIQVLQNTDGKPVLKLLGTARELSEALEITAWFISITHSTNFSFAIAVAERC